MARYREIRYTCSRHAGMATAAPGRYGEIWRDTGRYREIRYTCSRHADMATDAFGSVPRPVALLRASMSSALATWSGGVQGRCRGDIGEM